MKREIKFRVWNNIQNKMLQHEIVDYDFIFDGDVHNDFDVMQYTGLKDSNGKDWYEGDLVRVNEQAPIHEIFWCEDEMGWRIRLINSTSWFKINVPLFKRIGNIYENPELLSK